MAYIGSKPNDTRQLARREFSYAVTVASTTTFTGSDAGGKTLSYQPGELEVYMNGVRLDPADYTATTGSSVVLGSGANIGDNINIFAGQILPTDDYVSKAAGGTFDGNLLVGLNATEAVGTNAGTQLRADGLVYAAVTSDAHILSRRSSDGAILNLRKDTTTVGSIGTIANYMTVGTSDSGILFHSGEDNIQPWNVSTNAGRDNAINIGASNARFKDAYLSGGVYLGGTGTANKLDDYEEGTWTPVVAGSTSGGWTSRTGYTQGYYTKIGSYVHVDVRFETTSRNSPVGNMEILGLPFPAKADTGTVRNQYMVYTVFRGMNPTSDSMGHVALLSGGNSHFNIFQRRNNSAYSFDIQNVTEVPANCEGHFHFSYRTN
jgi:hypothetical protein